MRFFLEAKGPGDGLFPSEYDTLANNVSGSVDFTTGDVVQVDHRSTTLSILPGGTAGTSIYNSITEVDTTAADASSSASAGSASLGGTMPQNCS